MAVRSQEEKTWIRTFVGLFIVAIIFAIAAAVSKDVFKNVIAFSIFGTLASLSFLFSVLSSILLRPRKKYIEEEKKNNL